MASSDSEEQAAGGDDRKVKDQKTGKWYEFSHFGHASYLDRYFWHAEPHVAIWNQQNKSVAIVAILKECEAPSSFPVEYRSETESGFGVAFTVNSDGGINTGVFPRDANGVSKLSREQALDLARRIFSHFEVDL